MDVAREWTPARAEPTGEATGPDKKKMFVQPSDHKAQKLHCCWIATKREKKVTEP